MLKSQWMLHLNWNLGIVSKPRVKQENTSAFGPITNSIWELVVGNKILNSSLSRGNVHVAINLVTVLPIETFHTHPTDKLELWRHVLRILQLYSAAVDRFNQEYSNSTGKLKRFRFQGASVYVEIRRSSKRETVDEGGLSEYQTLRGYVSCILMTLGRNALGLRGQIPPEIFTASFQPKLLFMCPHVALLRGSRRP